MAKIKCPYCCHSFDPSLMVFRLENPIKMNGYHAEEEDDFDDHYNHYKEDAELIEYYQRFEKMSDDDAREHALQKNPYGCITYGEMMENPGSLEYDENVMNEYGFVTNLTYEGQELNQRVCPKCHNFIFDKAGLHEMKLISLYGNTNSGKTVYLNILQAMLQGEPALENTGDSFKVRMSFVGSKEDTAEHTRIYNKLLREKVLPDATPSGKVQAPQVFECSYTTADNPGKYRNIFLVFRDIPGEDCTKGGRDLDRYGFYLKNSDGFIVLLDSSKLKVSVPYLHEGEAANIDQMQAIDNLENLLSHKYMSHKVPIPTAVVLAKCDLLKHVPDITMTYKNDYAAISEVQDANNLHKQYLDKRITDELHKTIDRILHGLQENHLIGAFERRFEEYNYFWISTLGENPYSVEDDDFNTVKKVDSIRPYRIAEPLFWIMAKNDLIPYRYVERYRKESWPRAGTVEGVDLLYLESQKRNGDIVRMYKRELDKKKIKPNGKGWRLIERTNGF